MVRVGQIVNLLIEECVIQGNCDFRILDSYNEVFHSANYDPDDWMDEPSPDRDIDDYIRQGDPDADLEPYNDREVLYLGVNRDTLDIYI